MQRFDGSNAKSGGRRFFFGLECALYVMRRAVQMPESLIK
jgi:hypothetical protein